MCWLVLLSAHECSEQLKLVHGMPTVCDCALLIMAFKASSDSASAALCELASLFPRAIGLLKALSQLFSRKSTLQSNVKKLAKQGSALDRAQQRHTFEFIHTKTVVDGIGWRTDCQLMLLSLLDAVVHVEHNHYAVTAVATTLRVTSTS
eukprot:14292-Heterococcus_DN1.PRE.2